jgi:hypothetical protein
MRTDVVSTVVFALTYLRLLISVGLRFENIGDFCTKRPTLARDSDIISSETSFIAHGFLCCAIFVHFLYLIF